VRVEGSPSVTTLTWRATAREGSRVVYAIESATRAPDGRVLAETRSEERADGFGRPDPPGTVVSTATESVEVAGRTLAATRRVVRLPGGDETTVWRSEEVPFGGLVRSRAPGGVEQSLVAFGRGRTGG
jgi:hypothetical protein